MKLNKSKKGISLIVLVITIVVIIILASAIILSLSGSDIRNKANEAVSSNDIAVAKELVAVAQSEWEINYDELAGKYHDFKEYATEKLQKAGMDNVVASNTGAVNTVYTDKAGKTAIVPEGFSVSMVASEQTIADGLVIIDKDGNEFVWVPVDDMDMFKRTTTYTGTITEPGGSYTEPYNVTGDPTGEVAEYNAMKASVETNKGFYIGRYEAGKEGTDTLVSKKGATIWTNIEWGASMTDIGTEGAVHRARQMYKSSKSVVSTLCYSVQWDSALQFIATKDADYPTNSNGKGYYAYDESGNLIEGMEEEVQVAGYYAVNNIYDMAGNAYEWTMEAVSTYGRVIRGGFYGRNAFGSSLPSFTRHNNLPATAVDYCGFRLALYIK